MTARWAFAQGMILVTIAFVACRDVTSPTSPELVPTDRLEGFEPVPGGANLAVPVQFPNEGSGTVALPAFAKRTLLRVTITGTTSRVATAYNTNGYGLPKETGPGGAVDVDALCHLWVKVEYPGGSGGTAFTPPCGTFGTAIGYVFSSAGNIAGGAVRDGISRNCYASPPPPYGMGPCWEYSANQTVTLERVTADFDLTASPTSVRWGDTVAVTASISPGTVDGQAIPWTIDSTRWMENGVPKTSPCSWADFLPQNVGPSRVCRKPFKRSGTLIVSTSVNTVVQKDSVTITVAPLKLKLTASRVRIESSTDTVTFTASLQYQPASLVWNLSSWEWKPDSGALWTGISTPQCPWNEKTCKRTVSRSGTMKVRATLDGIPDSATVSLSGRPCAARVLPPGYWRISTAYGAVDGTHSKPHLGRDYAAPIGQPVYAPHAGTVVEARRGSNAGKLVVVDGSTVITYFYHLDSYVVSVGQPVVAGTLLGYSGNTGYLPNGKPVGPHLHFQQHASGPFIWDPETKRAPRETAIPPCVF